MRSHKHNIFLARTSSAQPHTKAAERYREMLRCCNFLTALLLLSPAIGVARVPSGDSPAFTAVPELRAGFDLLYEQKFAEARQTFASWESRNLEDPFGEVAVAASYLFEELYLQGVLTSDFFLNEKRFLHGIDGRPNPERMRHFGEALTRARELAKVRQKTNPNDGEALLGSNLRATHNLARNVAKTIKQSPLPVPSMSALAQSGQL